MSPRLSWLSSGSHAASAEAGVSHPTPAFPQGDAGAPSSAPSQPPSSLVNRRSAERRGTSLLYFPSLQLRGRGGTAHGAQTSTSTSCTGRFSPGPSAGRHQPFLRLRGGGCGISVPLRAYEDIGSTVRTLEVLPPSESAGGSKGGQSSRPYSSRQTAAAPWRAGAASRVSSARVSAACTESDPRNFVAPAAYHGIGSVRSNANHATISEQGEAVVHIDSAIERATERSTDRGTERSVSIIAPDGAATPSENRSPTARDGFPSTLSAAVTAVESVSDTPEDGLPSPNVGVADPGPPEPEQPAAGGCERPLSWPLPLAEAPAHLPVVECVPVSAEETERWVRYGGSELEPSLASGAIALLDAVWLVALAEGGGVLLPRQALPDEAFLSAEQVRKRCVPGIVLVSHCWLQPDHPDPHGHNLRLIARALKLMLEYLSFERGVAVFLDFCSIHQKCRGPDGAPGGRVLSGGTHEPHGAIGRYASEDALFRQALQSLSTFYSHPETHVWMLTAFPPDYDKPGRYVRAGNTAPYAQRGWCFCESSWAAMVKSADLVLDLGIEMEKGEDGFLGLRQRHSRGRKAPVLPHFLDDELERKHFTNGKDDRPVVAALYREGFGTRFGETTALSYFGLGWRDEEAASVAAVLAAGATPKLESLVLSSNDIGAPGAAAIATALSAAPALKDLWLANNRIGADGARALAAALPSAAKLERLWLDKNDVGDEGARALARVLSAAPALTGLYLKANAIGADGARALAAALPGAALLKELNLMDNTLGNEGAQVLAESLTAASGLLKLHLGSNAIAEREKAALRDAARKRSGEPLQLVL